MFAINSVGDFVLLLGKVFIVLATVLIGIELIQVSLDQCSTKINKMNCFTKFYLLQQNKPGLHYTTIPVVICGIFAFLVCHCFLTVYEMIIDTIFICFCEDCERNDGISRPYFMSRGLMEFVQNSKQSLDVASSSSKKAVWGSDANIAPVA